MALVKKIERTTKVTREYYSDFVSSLQPAAGSKDIIRAVNDNAIKTSIRNILLTNFGERFFNYDFGSNIRAFLFEPIDTITESTLKTAIETSIVNFEPRAKIIDVIISGNDQNNSYNVTIVFSTINTPDLQQLDLILTRVR
jgi:phage baseplate assembly protein W